jgi:hypothetical protein
MITYVTVCKNVILSNRKHGTNKPPLRISRGKYGKPTHAHNFNVAHPEFVHIVYAPNDPLPWGARAWIEIHDSRFKK